MNLLDYTEAAKILKVAPTTLRKKVLMREIPHLKPFGPHGRVLFDQDELEKFLNESRVEAVRKG